MDRLPPGMLYPPTDIESMGYANGTVLSSDRPATNRSTTPTGDSIPEDSNTTNMYSANRMALNDYEPGLAPQTCAASVNTAPAPAYSTSDHIPGGIMPDAFTNPMNKLELSLSSQIYGGSFMNPNLIQGRDPVQRSATCPPSEQYTKASTSMTASFGGSGGTIPFLSVSAAGERGSHPAPSPYYTEQGMQQGMRMPLPPSLPSSVPFNVSHAAFQPAPFMMPGPYGPTQTFWPPGGYSPMLPLHSSTQHPHGLMRFPGIDSSGTEHMAFTTSSTAPCTPQPSSSLSVMSMYGMAQGHNSVITNNSTTSVTKDTTSTTGADYANELCKAVSSDMNNMGHQWPRSPGFLPLSPPLVQRSTVFAPSYPVSPAQADLSSKYTCGIPSNQHNQTVQTVVRHNEVGKLVHQGSSDNSMSSPAGVEVDKDCQDAQNLRRCSESTHSQADSDPGYSDTFQQPSGMDLTNHTQAPPTLAQRKYIENSSTEQYKDMLLHASKETSDLSDTPFESSASSILPVKPVGDNFSQNRPVIQSRPDAVADLMCSQSELSEDCGTEDSCTANVATTAEKLPGVLDPGQLLRESAITSQSSSSYEQSRDESLSNDVDEGDDSVTSSESSSEIDETMTSSYTPDTSGQLDSTMLSPSKKVKMNKEDTEFSDDDKPWETESDSTPTEKKQEMNSLSIKVDLMRQYFMKGRDVEKDDYDRWKQGNLSDESDCEVKQERDEDNEDKDLATSGAEDNSLSREANTSFEKNDVKQSTDFSDEGDIEGNMDEDDQDAADDNDDDHDDGETVNDENKESGALDLSQLSTDEKDSKEERGEGEGPLDLSHSDQSFQEDKTEMIPMKDDPDYTPPAYKRYSDSKLENLSSSSLLDRIEVTVKIGEEHATMVDGRKKWKCHLCPKMYTTRNNLVTHILGHGNIKQHCCVICGKFFKQLSHLNTHMLTHGKVKPYSCTICGKNFTQSSHIKRHMATHMETKPHTCDVCGRGFAYPSELNVHKKKHLKGKDNKCVDCGKEFDTLDKLRYHHRVVHKNKEDLTCSECGKVFVYPSQLRDHMVKHSGIRPHICKECGMDFMKEHHLKAHQFTHTGLRPFNCAVCNRSFNQKANMQRHMLIHDKERRFRCETCGKFFSQPQTLKAHQVTHAEKKPFQCKVCGKEFGRVHNLQGHMHIHDNSRPYNCFCGSSFTLKGNLNRHKKVKHGLNSTVDCSEEEAARILNMLAEKIPSQVEPPLSGVELRNSLPFSNSTLDDSREEDTQLTKKKKRKSHPRKKAPSPAYSSEDDEDDSFSEDTDLEKSYSAPRKRKHTSSETENGQDPSSPSPDGSGVTPEGHDPISADDQIKSYSTPKRRRKTTASSKANGPDKISAASEDLIASTVSKKPRSSALNFPSGMRLDLDSSGDGLQDDTDIYTSDLKVEEPELARLEALTGGLEEVKEVKDEEPVKGKAKRGRKARKGIPLSALLARKMKQVQEDQNDDDLK